MSIGTTYPLRCVAYREMPCRFISEAELARQVASGVDRKPDSPTQEIADIAGARPSFLSGAG